MSVACIEEAWAARGAVTVCLLFAVTAMRKVPVCLLVELLPLLKGKS